MWLFCYFNFERNQDVLNSKESVHFVKQNLNFSKDETETKMENLT